MYTPYEIIKYWLPLASAFTMVWGIYRGTKKNISRWAESLFENHLKHIQKATEETVAETKKTNVLLGTAAMNIADVKLSLADHVAKAGQVWDGVTKTLTVLEDRTRRPRVARKR